MRTRIIVGGLLVACLMPSSVRADMSAQGPVPQHGLTASSLLTLNDAIVNALFQEPGPLKDREYRAAKNRRLTGIVLTVGGVIIALAASRSSVDRFTCRLESLATDCESSNTGVQLAGLGGAGFGFYLWMSGQSRMDVIERERAANAASSSLRFRVTRGGELAKVVVTW